MKPNDISPKGELHFAFRPLSGKEKCFYLCVLSVSSKAGGEILFRDLTYNYSGVHYEIFSSSAISRFMTSPAAPMIR